MRVPKSRAVDGLARVAGRVGLVGHGLRYSLAAAAAVVTVAGALSAGSAAAGPLPGPSSSPAASTVDGKGLVQDVAVVCNGWGRCWTTPPPYGRPVYVAPNPYYRYGYYGPPPYYYPPPPYAYRPHCWWVVRATVWGPRQVQVCN